MGCAIDVVTLCLIGVCYRRSYAVFDGVCYTRSYAVFGGGVLYT